MEIALGIAVAVLAIAVTIWQVQKHLAVKKAIKAEVAEVKAKVVEKLK